MYKLASDTCLGGAGPSVVISDKTRHSGSRPPAETSVPPLSVILFISQYAVDALAKTANEASDAGSSMVHVKRVVTLSSELASNKNEKKELRVDA